MILSGVKFVIPGAPRSKKNSQQIVRIKGRYMVIPSKAFRDFEKDCLPFLIHVEPVLGPCNVKCEYYMPTRRRVDLVNLQEATLDILVKAGILIDDNSNVVVSMDGSRVYYDKENPRTEIEIKEIKDAE